MPTPTVKRWIEVDRAGQVLPLRLPCEPITEAGALLIPLPAYTRGRPVYEVILNRTVIGVVSFTRMAGWVAHRDDRLVAWWDRDHDDGCIAYRRSFPDRHWAVVALVRLQMATWGQIPTPLHDLTLEEPHGQAHPTL